MAVLHAIDDWPVPNAAAAVVGRNGVLATHGDIERPFALASVTKPLVARAAQVAIEEGAVELDTAAGPPGSTVRHLLAHASGLAMLDGQTLARPGARRMYSNYGFAVLAETVQEASGIEFGRYLAEAVLEPLGMTATRLDGGAQTAGTARRRRSRISRRSRSICSRPQRCRRRCMPRRPACSSPGLDGVLPGYGVQRPNDWGLGFEIRDSKTPHWTGANNSPGSYGHFGQSGTLIWADPVANLALVVLTDRDFGDWAVPLWPAISDNVLSTTTRTSAT